ncbi:dienelactone hydrolase family protein [Longispora sp. K20-0274]|uniref:dienelactone hydrolase family protein n=1 Tax=Longispora sp. K20-0274 TaxID=3088255 RepID=UPI00399B7666
MPGVSTILIGAAGVTLDGELTVPVPAAGVVVFAHGSGSSRHSPRNRYVAGRLAGAGFATLLVDLLTRAEDASPEARFDIPLLAGRLVGLVGSVRDWPGLTGLPVGLFGASTGAAAALVAAGDLPGDVAAVVSRGGRPDLAGGALGRVSAPTLLIVGGRDLDVLDLNRRAARELAGPVEVVVVPGATHLFEEPGALEEVADLAADWFTSHLG